MDGQVNLDDFTVLGDSFGLGSDQNPQKWLQGDLNYNALVNLDDFTILATTFGLGTQNMLRPGPDALPPLGELYIALLDYPQIYWEARGSRELWAMFEPFESINLGPIPAMPEGLRAIPEPATTAAVLALALAARRTRGARRDARGAILAS